VPTFFYRIRRLPDGAYRLRYRCQGHMRLAPKHYPNRSDAERALWGLADQGRTDSTHDQRFRALVLLATFASLRWGEVTALRRADLDLTRATVRVRLAYVERSTGELILGPPKSRAGRRVVGIPQAIVPALREHLSAYVGAEPDALLFTGVGGGPIRRSKFNKLSGWPHAARSIGAEGLHVHDLRHAGNHFAAASGAQLQDLMTRMGHDSERAAMIYQHEARGADSAITNAINAHIEAGQDDDDGTAGAFLPAG
jgi:integrase